MCECGCGAGLATIALRSERSVAAIGKYAIQAGMTRYENYRGWPLGDF